MNNCIHLLSDTNYSQKEIINLLSNLSECVIIEDNEWVRFIKNIPDNQKIFCYTLENRLVGMITVIIEKKIIHGYKCVGHIEDLVVDPKYRNKNIGGQLLDYFCRYLRTSECISCTFLAACLTESIRTESFSQASSFKTCHMR